MSNIRKSDEERDKWADDPLFTDDDTSYYEDEILPKIERRVAEEKARCPHDHFFIYCSTCRHVIGSEVNDPYDALREHRAKHAELNNVKRNEQIM